MKRIALFAALSLVLGAAGCSHEDHHSEIPKYAVTSPVKRDQKITRNYVSQIRSIQHIELRALEKGYLTNIYIDEGQSVVKDTLLFQVMPSLYQAEYGKALAESQFAKIEYENTLKLQQSNIVAQSELNLAKAKLDQANANLELAKVHLSFTQIKAPFDGIVGRLLVRQGSLLEEGELLTTLSDNHEMWVYFNVPEAEYLNFKKSDQEKTPTNVRLRMANGKIYDKTGTITAIEADFNNETGNIAFRATFPNSDGLLRHGQTGNVLLDSTVKDAIIIPQKATFEILDKRFIYVLDNENKVSSRMITVLEELPDLFVIKGVNEENRILLEGIRKVRDGDVVEPDFQEPEKVLPKLRVYAE